MLFNTISFLNTSYMSNGHEVVCTLLSSQFSATPLKCMQLAVHRLSREGFLNTMVWRNHSLMPSTTFLWVLCATAQSNRRKQNAATLEWILLSPHSMWMY